MRLYVTGGTGLVGSNIIKLAQERYNLEVIASLFGPPPSSEVAYQLDALDMNDHEAVKSAIRKYKPDLVIHCAALLDQVYLYKNRSRSWSVMVEGTRAFATACREIGARLVFISSDWVFDGREPLVDEDSPPFPVNFYGILKFASERELSMMGGLNYAVARLAGVYGINYAIPNMTRWDQGVGYGDLPNYYVDRFSKKQPVEVWTDGLNEEAHPTLAGDGADLVLRLALHDEKGIFHCFGCEPISRLDLAHRVAEVFRGDVSLIRATPVPENIRQDLADITIPYRTRASTDKTAKILGRKGLNVIDGLKEFKQEWEAFQSKP